MKILDFYTLPLLTLFTLMLGCRNDVVNAQATSDNSAEAAAVKTTIINQAKAMTEFTRTRDKSSILKFTTKHYIGISDGEWESAEGSDKFLLQVLEQINLGGQIGISYQVSDIPTHVSGESGDHAWAMYDFNSKLGRGGYPVHEKQGRCTAILRKADIRWFYEHEHGSSPKFRFKLG